MVSRRPSNCRANTEHLTRMAPGLELRDWVNSVENSKDQRETPKSEKVRCAQLHEIIFRELNTKLRHSPRRLVRAKTLLKSFLTEFVGSGRSPQSREGLR